MAGTYWGCCGWIIGISIDDYWFESALACGPGSLSVAAFIPLLTAQRYGLVGPILVMPDPTTPQDPNSNFRRKTSLRAVGDGQYRSRLQKHAETLGISKKVRFWGSISNHFLPNFYAAADLFVLPSLERESGGGEGQGVVLLEAFAARLCVVATPVGGISEVVEDGYTGMLVKPHNPKQLAATIEKLLSDSKLRTELVENAYTKVKNITIGRKLRRRSNISTAI